MLQILASRRGFVKQNNRKTTNNTILVTSLYLNRELL